MNKTFIESSSTSKDHDCEIAFDRSISFAQSSLYLFKNTDSLSSIDTSFHLYTRTNILIAQTLCQLEQCTLRRVTAIYPTPNPQEQEQEVAIF